MNGIAGLSARGRVESACALVATGAGLWAFSGNVAHFWNLWTHDALRSIGLLIPPAALLLGWRAVKGERWEPGSWWGLALAALALACASLTSAQVAPLLFPYAGGGALWINPFPAGLLVAAYLSGAVILFGGAPMWKRLWFPLFLLLFLNPVPNWFTGLVDLPLQSFAAQVTRGFAHLVQVPFEGEALKLMFGPRLGIFIAPGCDGLHGAITLGYLALVAGYVTGLRRWRWIAYVLGAVAVGYLFNLLRLCCVVLYYRVAQSWPAMGAHGTAVDYVIGGTLFLVAGLYLARAPRWLGMAPA